MAQGRKYTNLPDLDTSPDIYESHETADTAQDAASSPVSTTYHSDESDDSSDSAISSVEDAIRKTSRVSRQTINATEARSQFKDSRVDARGVDFSDRISSGRKSYRVPHTGKKSRRRRIQILRGAGPGGEREQPRYVDEYGFDSDDDDDDDDEDEGEEETYEARVARLRREIEEVKAEGERRRTDSDIMPHSVLMAELGKQLASLQAQSRTLRPPAFLSPPSSSGQTKSPASTNGVVATATATAADPPDSLPIPTIPPADLKTILNKTTAFESRLTLLENALGLSSLTSIQPSAPPTPQNVLNTLQKLETQYTTLTNTTLPSLEILSSRIHRLTTDASRLAEARKEAREAREEAAYLSTPSAAANLSFLTGARGVGAGSNLTSATPSDSASATAGMAPQQAAAPDLVDAETESKITALHDSLKSMAQLSPLLPSVLERLKSLRVLHADAATISERFEEAEKLQARLGGEIERWRGALEALGGRLTDVEKTGVENREVVEGWVEKLENRIDRLEK